MDINKNNDPNFDKSHQEGRRDFLKKSSLLTAFSFTAPLVSKAAMSNFDERIASLFETQKVSYSRLMETKGLSQIDLTIDSKGLEINGSKYSYSVHFVKLRVHSSTGQIKIDHIVSCAALKEFLENTL